MVLYRIGRERHSSCVGRSCFVGAVQLAKCVALCDRGQVKQITNYGNGCEWTEVINHRFVLRHRFVYPSYGLQCRRVAIASLAQYRNQYGILAMVVPCDDFAKHVNRFSRPIHGKKQGSVPHLCRGIQVVGPVRQGIAMLCNEGDQFNVELMCALVVAGRCRTVCLFKAITCFTQCHGNRLNVFLKYGSLD